MKFDEFFGSPEDREIVLAAVTQNGEALEFAPKWCQDEVTWVKWWVSCDVTRPGNPPKAIAFIGREMGPPKFQRQSIYRVGEILEFGPSFWWVDGFVFLVGWEDLYIYVLSKHPRFQTWAVFTLNWLQINDFYQKWLFHQSFRTGLCQGSSYAVDFVWCFFDQQTIWGSTWGRWCCSYVMLHGFAATVGDSRKR